MKSDTEDENSTIKDFFLSTLDSHGCIPIAFELSAFYWFDHVGLINAIEEIEAEITADMGRLLAENLDQEAIKQLSTISNKGGSRATLHTWSNAWKSDVEEIVRN